MAVFICNIFDYLSRDICVNYNNRAVIESITKTFDVNFDVKF